MRLNEGVDERAELEDLQRRAYGPEPDLDAAGRARLRELQERVRAARAARAEGAAPPVARTPAPAPLVDPAPVGPVPVDRAPVDRAPAPVEPGPDDTGPDRTAPDGPAAPAAPDETAAPRRRGWRRPAALIAVGIVAGAAISAGVAAAVGAGEAPDAVLGVSDDEDRPPTAFDGVEDSTLYELYHGIDVRSVQTSRGPCLYASYAIEVPGGEGAFGTAGDMACTPPGLAPVVEMWVGSGPLGWSMGEIEGFASGTYLRFELDGDVVNVWQIDPPTWSPSPAAP